MKKSPVSPVTARVRALKGELAEFIDAARLIDDPLRTLAYGTDASFYRLIPQLVVKVVNEQEVARLLRLANRYHTPLTFRAAGTSLSGQAITDSVLVMLEGNAWREYSIGADAQTIRLQPGIIGAQANRYLAAHGRKIGPDPASIASCKIGGIAANNASGMCCGVAQNSYQTLDSLRLILADGTLLDTADVASREAFRVSHAELVDEIEALVRDVQGNQALADRIRHKFKIKNTTGYSLNALVDYQDPIDVLAHLMIGSEGTLGFIAEITYRTVRRASPTRPAHWCSFAARRNAACEAVALTQVGAGRRGRDHGSRGAVRSVAGQARRCRRNSPRLPDQAAAALLIETRAGSRRPAWPPDIVRVTTCAGVLTGRDNPAGRGVLPTSRPKPARACGRSARVCFPSVGAVRESRHDRGHRGHRVPGAATRRRHGRTAGSCSRRHGYDNAIIFGHALEGNLHFVITPDFGDAGARLSVITPSWTSCVIMVVDRYDGSLKAEHSTGRNIAPYVELEWGAAGLWP